MEVYNGNPRHNSNNECALEFARKHNLRMISGSDFHQEQDVAKGGIITSEKIKNNSELTKILKYNEYELIKE